MLLSAVRSQATKGAPCIRSPMWSEQARKCRYKIYTVRFVNLVSQLECLTKINKIYIISYTVKPYLKSLIIPILSLSHLRAKPATATDPSRA